MKGCEMRLLGQNLKKMMLACLGLTLAFFLASCQTQHPKKNVSIADSEAILKASIAENNQLAQKSTALPAGINNALMPPLTNYLNGAKPAAQRFDVSANKLPAKEFYMGLIAGTNYNMVVHPDVNGTISLNLKNVTIQQAMDAVRDLYGYDYRRTSYGYEVFPPHLETRLFHVNYLDVQRSGKSITQISSAQLNEVGTINMGGTSGSTTGPTPSPTPAADSQIETKSEMHFWALLEKTLNGLVGKDDGRQVTVNAQAGIVTVRAYPAEINQVAQYIDSLQSSLERQVILEAKILEVQLSDEYQAGIDWGVLSNPVGNQTNGSNAFRAGIGQIGNQSFPDANIESFNGIFTLQIKGNFSALINLLQSQGNVQVLSSPRISTLNNQKAVIKVGNDQFFVTGVSTSNTVVGSSTIPSQDVALTPFFSGITLDVTPEISGDNTVILHIHPTVSKVTEQQKNIGLGTTATGSPNTLTLPLASSTVRESDNIVRAKNGQVIVIGGLMQNNTSENMASAPWLGKMPFVGSLFRNVDQQSTKSELVILLRPVVVNNATWNKALKNEQTRFKNLNRPFHAGSLPNVFGNEAEREKT